MTKQYISVSQSCYWRSLFKLIFISFLISLLVGCPGNVSRQVTFDETKGSEYYLSQVTSFSGDEKINWQLLAIRSLIIETKNSQAKQLINQLPSNLNSTQRQELLFLQGELAVNNQQSFDINEISMNNLSEAQLIRYYKIKIGLDKLKRDINAVAHDFIELEKYGSEFQQHDTINQTWNWLATLNDAEINSILVYADQPILQGWVDLIYTYKNNSNIYVIDASDDADTIASKQDAQLTLIKNAIKDWQLQYSTHPAAKYLPRTIYGEKYRLSDDINNKNIALFLPLTGSSKIFGDTIRQGYEDASRFFPQSGQQNITVYDTNSSPIDSLVKQAKQQGAELIVGPLLKQDVVSIVKISPDIPVLALNKVDDFDYSNRYSSNICFFALSPENEAKDAANHIYAQHKNSPLLILPSNDLGKRIATSFVQQWHLISPSSNGVYVQYFDSEKSLSQQMNSGRGIELEGSLLSNSSLQSGQQNSQNTLFSNVGIDDNGSIAPSFDAANQQFDAIYVYASYSELSLIKSMLEMVSNKKTTDVNGKTISAKKNVPAIYTSSKSNIANMTQDFRYDMDKVQFSDIPLIVTKHEMINELPNYIKDDYSLVRLYAMGVDAWQLANHFNQLKPYQIGILDGLTGNLSVANQCEITREFSWQQYLNGQEVAVQ